MVRRLCCGLVLLALTACGDDGKILTSDVGQTFPTPLPSSSNSNSNSATATVGMTTTGEPTTSATDTTGPDLTTSPTTTDPSTTSPSTTNPSTTGPMIECGNGIVEANEECDGSLGGQSCVGLGFVGGTLSCSGCLFDVSQCDGEDPCGDGVKSGTEACDCGPEPSPCTPAQLGNNVCTDFAAPKNGNYHGGTLACGTPQSCTLNTSACTYCGDGVRNGPEQCEGVNLGGQTCVGLGFFGGTLACSALCTFNTAGCESEGVCGDGTCGDNEDSCSCPSDCPDDPNSCSPCQCGDIGGNCYCDQACIQAGDCCPNGPC